MNETNLFALANEVHEQTCAWLAHAENELAAIETKMKEIEAAGMTPAIPSEHLREGKFLYHLYHRNEAGLYPTPSGARKVYIGADPHRIATARQQVKNRELWEYLDFMRRTTGGYLIQQRENLKALHRSLATFRRADPALLAQDTEMPARPAPPEATPEAPGPAPVLIRPVAVAAAAWWGEKLKRHFFDVKQRRTFEAALVEVIESEWRKLDEQHPGSWPEDVPPVLISSSPLPGFVLSEALKSAPGSSGVCWTRPNMAWPDALMSFWAHRVEVCEDRQIPKTVIYKSEVK